MLEWHGTYVNLFGHWPAAVRYAHRKAARTGRRYRVYYSDATEKWHACAVTYPPRYAR